MSTHALIAWLLIIGLGLAGVFFAAKTVEPTALLVATGIVSLLAAAVGIRERTRLLAPESGASRSRVESVTAFYMALVWLWGAAALLLVYTLVLNWHEWWHFCLGFALAGGLSLGFSALLGKDADAGRDDETMLKLGRNLALVQFVAMLVTIVGLFIDPDKEFLFIKEDDWAGNGIFLFGAIALAVLSGHALFTAKKTAS
jgi:hypothetical protein